MAHLQPNCCLKIDFEKVDKHAGSKWLIHDTKRRRDNGVARCDIKGSDGNMLNLIFWKKVQGQKHPGRWGLVEHHIPISRGPEGSTMPPNPPNPPPPTPQPPPPPQKKKKNMYFFTVFLIDTY